MASSSSTSTATRDSQQSHLEINSRLTWLLAFAAGVAVANLYYSQPLLALLAHSFALSSSGAGWLAMLTQLGYGLGLLLLVPLGDSRERRSLMVLLLLLEAVALLALALAPGVAWLTLACLLVGFLAVTPQVILPFAAGLASDARRARVVGSILSGILIGVLLARVASGLLGAALGWRAVYLCAAALMVLLALILWRTLPRQRPVEHVAYPRLLSSLWEILRGELALWPVCLFGGLTFAAFNVFWVTLPFLLQTPPYHFGSAVAGLFGLVGVAGAIAAPQVGRLADRTGRPRLTICLGLLLVLLSFGVFWLWGLNLWGLALGVILLDLGAQTNLTSCQALVQSLRPQARSRLNTIFMTSYFLGGACGSTLGASLWSLGRWSGVCLLGLGLLLLALLIFWLTGRRSGTSSGRTPE